MHEVQGLGFRTDRGDSCSGREKPAAKGFLFLELGKASKAGLHIVEAL